MTTVSNIPRFSLKHKNISIVATEKSVWKKFQKNLNFWTKHTSWFKYFFLHNFRPTSLLTLFKYWQIFYLLYLQTLFFWYLQMRNAPDNLSNNNFNRIVRSISQYRIIANLTIFVQNFGHIHHSIIWTKNAIKNTNRNHDKICKIKSHLILEMFAILSLFWPKRTENMRLVQKNWKTWDWPKRPKKHGL